MDKSSLSSEQLEELQRREAEQRGPNRKQRRAQMRANRQNAKKRSRQIQRSIMNNKLKGTPLMPGLIGPDLSPKKEEAAPETDEKPEIIL